MSTEETFFFVQYRQYPNDPWADGARFLDLDGARTYKARVERAQTNVGVLWQLFFRIIERRVRTWEREIE